MTRDFLPPKTIDVPGYGKYDAPRGQQNFLKHLEVSEGDDLVDGNAKAIDILAASLGEVRLTATTTLDEFGGLANHLTGIQTMVADHVVAHHDGELGLVVVV